MPDKFVTQDMGPAGPITNAFAITPGAALFDQPTRALWVGGAGNVALETVGGDSVTFSGVAAGTLLPVRARKVVVSGTTATSILGLY